MEENVKLFLITILVCGLFLGGCKDEVSTSTEVKETAHESASVVEQAEQVVSDVAEQAQQVAAEVVEQATEVVTEVVTQAETQVADAAAKVSAEGSHMVNDLMGSATDKEEEGSDALSSAMGHMSDAVDPHK
jgi:vacuolar-type H+-ATPase subunit H